jgi:hypothetical protein
MSVSFPLRIYFLFWWLRERTLRTSCAFMETQAARSLQEKSQRIKVKTIETTIEVVMGK